MASFSVVYTSKPFQACVEHEQANTTAENLEKGISELSRAFGADRDCLGHFTHDNADAIIAAFTVILAIATIFLWAATRGLVRSAEKTAVRQLRAYITIKTGDAYRQRKGWKFEFRPVILNTGQTPAYRVNIRSGISFLSDDEAAQFDWEANLAPATNVGVLTLGTQQDRFTRTYMDRGLTRTELRKFASRSHSFYVFGKVTYEDTFGIHRTTRYCYAVARWHKRAPHTWLTTYKYNDSD